MKISVIGAGYVGLTTAACLSQIGHEVFCSESDVEKLSKLQNGGMPIFEPHLEDVVKSVRASRVGCASGLRKRPLPGETRSSFALELRPWLMVTRTFVPSKESHERSRSVPPDIG